MISDQNLLCGAQGSADRVGWDQVDWTDLLLVVQAFVVVLQRW